MLGHAVSSNIRQMPPSLVLGESPGPARPAVSHGPAGGLRRPDAAAERPGSDLAKPDDRAFSHSSQSRLQPERACRITGLSRASAVTMVDQLEATGLVERRAGADARTNALFITGAGRRRGRGRCGADPDQRGADLRIPVPGGAGNVWRQLLEKVISRNVEIRLERRNVRKPNENKRNQGGRDEREHCRL